MINYISIAIGGALGSLSRFGLNELIKRNALTTFPLGTFVVNLSGCFMIGILWNVCIRHGVNEQMKFFLFAGFIGAFTTFSTFALENVELFKLDQANRALLYILLSNVLGIFCVWSGAVIADHLI